MRDNLAAIASLAETSAKLQSGDLVVDIGCNDGTLLKSYQNPEIRRLALILQTSWFTLGRPDSK